MDFTLQRIASCPRSASGAWWVRSLRGFVLALVSALATVGHATPTFALKEGDRVVLLGDSFIENERHVGWIELMLTTRFPDRAITFRNLGWSGDTPAGASRAGLSQFAAGREPADEGWKQLVRQVAEAQPTVAVIGYGMASSFEGEAGLVAFESQYVQLLDTLKSLRADVRCVLVGPPPHEHLGPPWPDPAAHRAQLEAYDQAVRRIAERRGCVFVSLLDPLTRAGRESPVTHDSIHLNATGYRRAAEVIEDALFGEAGVWRTSRRVANLRQAIVRKNDWYYHRWRPNNFVYSFGFLKGHQGDHFREEIARFDDYVAAEEHRIAQLRTLEVDDVPAVPARPLTPADATPASGSRPLAGTTAYGLVFAPDDKPLGEQPDPKFEVADGLEVTLWARNPLLRNPIQMNFDSDGRLWVATSDVYPQLAPGQAATDRIIVLEDTQGNGRADKATVFADDLLIPTSVEPGDGGVYVTHSNELLHLRDTDGDGKADERRTLLRGFGMEDGHHVVHGLKWGPDGRLYLNQSVYARSHLETPHGVVRLKAGGIFRFDPDNHHLEVAYRGFVNPWGHQFDLYGQSFVTDGAGHLGISWGVPGATYNTLAPARRTLPSVSAGVYAKFIGLEIIRSQHFPEQWQGNAITCDFRAHTVMRLALEEQGTAYVTRELPPILRSTDQHFRPVDVKLGPDGALYLADWSNPIIQHSGVDFREPRRDREHGRIWRIAAKGRAPLPVRRYAAESPARLLDALLSPNNYDRERARRVLIARGFETVSSELATWLARNPHDEALLQGMWLYQAFDRPDGALLRRLLAASDHRIRAAAVRALPADMPIELLARSIADPHPRVRLEAVRTLARVGTAQAAELALSVLERPMDPFLDYALWLTVNELAGPWLTAVKAGAWSGKAREKQLEFALSAVETPIAGEVLGRLLGPAAIPEENGWIELIGRAGGPSELKRLYEHVAGGGFSENGVARALAALGEAARLRSLVPEVSPQALQPLLAVSNDRIRLPAIQLAGAWKAGALAGELMAVAGHERTAEPEREAAFAALRAIGGESVIQGLARLARTAPVHRIRAAAVAAFAGLELEMAMPDVLEVLRTSEPTVAQALWRELLGIPKAGTKIASALPAAQLPRAVAEAGLRPAREGNRNQALVDALLKSAGLALPVQLAPAELRALAEEAIAKGDAARGERIYRRTELACVACHAIGGAGGKVGPDLTSIGATAPPDYLLRSLVDPNAQIKQGYDSVLLETRDQRQFSGGIVREDADQVILRDAAGNEIALAARDIVRRTSLGSLMPAGLMDSLLAEERLDLIKFLSMLGKPGRFDATQGGVARVWKVYPMVSRLQLIPVERIVAGDFTLDHWLTMHALTDGTLPKELLEPLIPVRGAPIRGLFAAARFHSSRAAEATFELTAETKGVWVNGRPVKPGRNLRADTKTGENVIVVQLFETERSRLPEAMKLRSDDVSFLSFDSPPANPLP